MCDHSYWFCVEAWVTQNHVCVYVRMREFLCGCACVCVCHQLVIEIFRVGWNYLKEKLLDRIRRNGGWVCCSLSTSPHTPHLRTLGCAMQQRQTYIYTCVQSHSRCINLQKTKLHWWNKKQEGYLYRIKSVHKN